MIDDKETKTNKPKISAVVAVGLAAMSLLGSANAAASQSTVNTASKIATLREVAQNRNRPATSRTILNNLLADAAPIDGSSGGGYCQYIQSGGSYTQFCSVENSPESSGPEV
jgi:uncharacterized protein (UPF0147 family)